MNLYFYKNNLTGNILKDYNINVIDIEKNENPFGFLLLPHFLDKLEIKNVFSKYKNENIFFIIDFTFEPYTTLSFINYFYTEAKTFGIKKDRLILLYNNSYQSGFNSYFYKDEVINTISFPRWYYEYSAFLDQYPLNRYDYCDYDFTCFNYQGRTHKKNTVMYIDKKNFNCLSTYVHGKDFNSPSVKTIDDTQTEMHLSNYYRGKVNICVETLYYKEPNGWTDIICVTEKVFRNLYFKIPFTVVGNRYTLAYLRSLGFKTFDSLIDESYDYQIDSYRYKESIHAANNLLEYWNSPELDDILTYNYEFISNKNNAEIHIKKNLLDNLSNIWDNRTPNLI